MIQLKGILNKMSTIKKGLTMWKNKNIFKYTPLDTGIDDIGPSKNYIPDWFKSIKAYNKSNMVFDKNNNAAKNLKSCIPFFDTLLSGYTIELWCDIFFDEKDKSIKWAGNVPPFQQRKSETTNVPTPAGYDETMHYMWRLPYAMKTPPGYSLLISHPFNRYELPFLSSTGIVDAEKIMFGGQVPFFLKTGFSGLIEKGTPILQILPFKRENWKAEKDLSMQQEDNDERARSMNVFYGNYKNNKWFKKTYE
jgi:hypothetical protein